MTRPLLELHAVHKSFRQDNRDLRILQNVNLSIAAGAAAAILGPSGSGKTTLLGLCAGLDLPTSGEICIQGTDIARLDEEERTRFRRQNVGFVFQNFRLIATLTALENVMVPLELSGDADAREKSEMLLINVGLDDRMTHYPAQLSGGEQQRVGLARAFAGKPALLLADEPTGNLDAGNAERIADLLFGLNQKEKTALLIVTHNIELANRTGRVLTLKNGALSG